MAPSPDGTLSITIDPEKPGDQEAAMEMAQILLQTSAADLHIAMATSGGLSLELPAVPSPSAT